MSEKRIALFILSLSSILVWAILHKTTIIGGKTQTILIVLSLIPFVFSSIKLLNDFKFEESYFKFIFSIFLFYELTIILRGWSFSYEDIKSFIQEETIFWPFIIPLFIFYDKNIVSFSLFFKWIFYSGIFFLAIALIFPSLIFTRSTAETYIGLFVPCGFLLLNAAYLDNKKVNISFLIILISIISLTYLARRSGLLTLLGFVISAYFLNIMSRSKSKLFRYFPLIIIIGAFILFNQYFENSREVFFDKMESRIYEDTRSGVFKMFFDDLSNNMIFGKGMNATYYSPVWGTEIDGVFYGEVEYRHIIENGYLQLLLTGGIVHILLFLLVLLPAAIKGIFTSSNQFTKACGIVILLWLIDMFLYGLPSLTLPYILVWICVGVCYKSSIRKMTNEEISSEFKKIDLL
jgi:hypothetical protein